jgi:hypothetical protein
MDIVLTAVLLLSSPTSIIGDGATNLRVEYLAAPLSIDTPHPRFSFVATCSAPCPRGTKIASLKITVVALATRT